MSESKAKCEKIKVINPCQRPPVSFCQMCVCVCILFRQAKREEREGGRVCGTAMSPF